MGVNGLAPGNAKTKLEKARALLSLQNPPAPKEPTGQDFVAPSATQTWQERLRALTGVDLTICPNCSQGRLIRRRLIASEATPEPTVWDPHELLLLPVKPHSSKA